MCGRFSRWRPRRSTVCAHPPIVHCQVAAVSGLPIPPCAARRLKALQGILLRRAVHLPPLIVIQASGWTVSPVRHSFRWPGAIDVGGGHGVLLTLIRNRHPDLSGVLFDAPDVIANRDETFDRLVTAGQATRVSGDFFQSVPAGGDDANDRQRPPTTARRIASRISGDWPRGIRPVSWPPGTGKTTPGYLYPMRKRRDRHEPADDRRCRRLPGPGSAG
jgi:hypothetical protein